ncbi:carbon-nitrogen hydrolase family protein [Sporanaerobacter acetigenes]|uniref:carbon-nitrogen hydrolase family protein n=1 Tax=Sporanaerobacter acetigenes TaxID=165813 RepID=UPI00332E0AB5
MIINSFKDIVACSVQFAPVWLNAEKNVALMMDEVVKAVEDKRANLIVFPELSNTGYIIKERDKVFGKDFYKASEPIPGPTSLALAKQAKELGVYIVAGLSEQHSSIPGMLFNSALLVGPNGDIIGIHRKIHIPGYERFYFCPGHEINVFKTDIGNIGMTICYDNQFPELTRIMSLKGMEILCMLWNMPDFSNNPEHLYSITSVRALENRVYAISSNRPSTPDRDISFIGASCISDPVGNLLCKAERDSISIFATLSGEVFAEDRFFQPIFRDRKPELYHLLADPI